MIWPDSGWCGGPAPVQGYCISIKRTHWILALAQARAVVNLRVGMIGRWSGVKGGEGFLPQDVGLEGVQTMCWMPSGLRNWATRSLKLSSPGPQRPRPDSHPVQETTCVTSGSKQKAINRHRGNPEQEHIYVQTREGSPLCNVG